ncbi:MAG: hypothetical protein HY769_05600 [Candidatus Stahlbacteria bacterium]|nr:hypothetical protein [Candidatus Stahlbacteria bacterium]
MEIAIGLIGVSITVLGMIFAYIWKSNGKLQKQMMTSLEQIEQGQKEIAQIVKDVNHTVRDVAQMVVDHSKILERIEARMSSK